jgi:opacity protein-like surface antigen
MKKLFVSAVAVLFLCTSSAVFADNIGAGLGKELLKGSKGKALELVGTFLNNICYNGTFAITTGTLGYKEGRAIGANEDVRNFVAQNMDGLATDIARGEGEYLDTLASLVQVEDKALFSSKMKENFKNIYTSYGVSAEQVTENIFKVIQS